MNSEKEKALPPENPLTENPDKDKKFLILLDLDSGFHTVAEAKTPIEPIPFGFHVLHYEGNYHQMQRLCRILNRRPALLSRRHFVL